MSTHLGACSEIHRWSEFGMASPSLRLEVFWSREKSVFCTESLSSSDFR